jgi:hypothetical protein
VSAPGRGDGSGSGSGGGDGMDAERDAWLREALRHAPDATAGAPPGVSDVILRRARQATAAATTAAPAQHATRSPAVASRTRSDAARRTTTPWAPLWSWLMQPTVASGFAGVMVATLVGVMWWGRPIDEPLREAHLPDAAAPALRSEAPTARADVPAPSAPATQAAPATPANAAPATQAAPATPVVPAPAAAATPQASGDSRLTVAESAARALPPREPDSADAGADKKLAKPDAQRALAESRATEKARKAASAEADESQRRSASAKPAPAGAAPLAAPTDAVAAASPAPPAASPAAPAAATAAAPPPAPVAGMRAANPFPERKREAVADSAQPMPAARARDKSAEPPAAAAPEPGPAQTAVQVAPPKAAGTITLERGAAAATAGRLPQLSANPSLAAGSASEPAFNLSASENPVARLRAALAAEPQVWTWQRGNGTEQPMNEAVQAWLGQLDDATRARWQAAPTAAAAGGAAPLRLLLLRNGRPHTTVHIEAAAVRLETAGGGGGGAATAAPPGFTPRAPVPAATAAALKATLEQATP